MRRFWDEWHSIWDLSIELSEIRDLGDTVIVLGGIKARGKASGVELESPVAYVFQNHFRRFSIDEGSNPSPSVDRATFGAFAGDQACRP
jgi:hypothetical protein